MGLFKKKENIPTIQPSASLPALPSLTPSNEGQPKRDLPELPTFPVSQKNENFNQEMVKSAVSDVPPQIETENTEIPNLQQFQAPQVPQQPAMQEFPKSPVMESPIPEIPKEMNSTNAQAPGLTTQSASLSPMKSTKTTKSNDPIFVRIDKFQEAQKNFEEIKAKTLAIQDVLKEIKEIKVQEEEELKGWGENIEKLKNRLAEIDNEIFSQL